MEAKVKVWVDVNLYRNSICQFSGVCETANIVRAVSAERQVRACLVRFMLLKTLKRNSARRVALLHIPDFGDFSQRGTRLLKVHIQLIRRTNGSLCGSCALKQDISCGAFDFFL
jgi:hypothetical protein